MLSPDAEWAVEYGGKKRSRKGGARTLPFDCCALSLQPFETPVCTMDGVLFDILHIMPFVLKNRCSPVTAEPLTPKGILHLKMAKNFE